MRKITLFGLSAAALAASGWMATASAQAPDATPPAASDSATPAPDSGAPAPKTVKHHKHMVHATKGKEGGDAAVEDLNAQSLDAAKAGKNFTPSATPAPAAKPVKAAKPMHPMHHHHMMKKKAEAADSSAPPADAGAAPPK